MKEKKYQIEVTETQLRLIADCVEDCHRFMAGQYELNNMTSLMENDREIQEGLKDIMLFFMPPMPEMYAYYDWAGHSCPNECQRKFIAQTYPIYREILHFLSVTKGRQGVYNSPTLTCDEGGPLIKIREI